MQKTVVMINVITEDNLIILTVKNTTPEKLSPMSARLAEIIEDQTGLVVEINQIVPSLVPSANGSCCVESGTASDVWFLAIDPDTQALLGVNSTKIRKAILSKSAQTNIRYTITGLLLLKESFKESP